jgi:hypothetical protein
MALVQCPECNHDLSDQAAACPHCAYPFRGSPHRRRSVRVIEKTGRTWKKIRVLGWLLVGAGGLVLFPAWAAEHAASAWVGSLIGTAGVACLGISRAGAWWYHG